VGRGDADGFSDLDLTIYVSNGLTYDKIFVYEGEVVQLCVTDQVPTEEQVKNNPWECRFIYESVAVHDPINEFHTLKDWVINYFSSTDGRENLAEKAIGIVNLRKNWAMESIQQGKLYSARLGAGSAWADAGFMYLFFKHETLSTGSLIPLLKNIKSNYSEYSRILPFSLDLLKDGTGKILRIVERHREFLRLKNPSLSHNFSISQLQDIITLQKAQRLFREQQFENILWQLSGELFMLYLEFSNGISFEDYLHTLPQTLQEDMSRIGFVALKEEQVMKICELSDEIVNLTIQFVNK
jgi:hypothetical protein